ncbi:MAG TPA: efflux transporter outer membrane subunit [Gammaproteobacteria bacterium]|jgi:multidrug efflux system outer membrane protein|nr:efflux transporter outer membrane subunit [Gammaproteobacteria bacterium]
MHKKLMIASLLMTLSGCMVGPDYKRPHIQTPSSYRHQQHAVAEAADMRWWKQFHDPVLNQLMVEALANNKDIKIATANIEQASGLLMTTRSALFPQINYNANGTRALSSENIAIPEPSPNPYNNFQLLAGASWEIDLWGRIRRQTESANAVLLASEEAKRGVVLSLVAEVGSAYIQLRALDEQLEISKKTLRAYKKSLRLFTLQHQYGQVSLINVEQARSQYETAAATIPQIRVQITNTENALSVLLGRNPGPIPRGKKITALSLPAIPAGIPSQLLERRPDILQAEQNLIAANAQIGAARALYFPTISLTGALGKNSEALGNLFTGSSKTWNYSGSITGPIFTAGAIHGQVVQATGAMQANLASYEQTIQKAFADVDNALTSRYEFHKKMTAQDNMVNAYKKYKFLAWHKYNEGYSPYLEVLFAESQLYPAQLTAAQTKAALLISAINIYKAMGGGWVDEAEKMTG